MKLGAGIPSWLGGGVQGFSVASPIITRFPCVMPSSGSTAIMRRDGLVPISTSSTERSRSKSSGRSIHLWRKLSRHSADPASDRRWSLFSRSRRLVGETTGMMLSIRPTKTTFAHCGLMSGYATGPVHAIARVGVAANTIDNATANRILAADTVLPDGAAGPMARSIGSGDRQAPSFAGIWPGRQADVPLISARCCRKRRSFRPARVNASPST